ETMNVDLGREYTARRPGVAPGPYVMTAVTDTGEGMDRETMARIFEPFFTTKEPGKGTGLGLATVEGIMPQSSGHIWVYSEPGRGTTFKIYLPRANGEAEHGASHVKSSPAAGQPVILLAEDEEMLREMAEETLAESGYTVLAAANAEEALRQAREWPGT